MDEKSRRKSDPAKALRRAALVLVSLDDAEAAALLRRMSAQQAEAITEAVANLREIDPAEQQAALADFRRQMASVPPDDAKVSAAKPGVEVLPEPPSDPTHWPARVIQASFDMGLAETWALALADCEPETVARVVSAINRRDRKRLEEFDRKRGPWRLDEPARARSQIFQEFRKSAGFAGSGM
ncbi:MAG: FliG C-terminal domain-containing protein [bacterium]